MAASVRPAMPQLVLQQRTNRRICLDSSLITSLKYENIDALDAGRGRANAKENKYNVFVYIIYITC